VGEAEIEVQVASEFYDFGLGEMDEGRVDADGRAAFDAGLGSERGHVFKGGDVFGAAIGVAGVIESIDADEDVGRCEDFGPGERERQEDGVAGGDVGDGDAVGDVREGTRLGDGEVGGEGGVADLAEIDAGDDVAGCAEGLRDAGGSRLWEFVDAFEAAGAL
jgi:hypothetical protein